MSHLLPPLTDFQDPALADQYYCRCVFIDAGRLHYGGPFGAGQRHYPRVWGTARFSVSEEWLGAKLRATGGRYRGPAPSHIGVVAFRCWLNGAEVMRRHIFPLAGDSDFCAFAAVEGPISPAQARPWLVKRDAQKVIDSFRLAGAVARTEPPHVEWLRQLAPRGTGNDGSAAR